MHLPKTILFDLDDTIVSFTHAVESAWKKVCDDFVSYYEVSFDSKILLQKINETRTWYWSDPVRHKTGRENLKNARRQVAQYAFETLNYYDNDKIIQFADKYNDLHDELLCLFDGAYEALQIIKNHNIRMGLITNGASQKQRGKLDRFGISHFFELILVDTEVGFSKPDVRIFEVALEKLMLKPNDVWMVGDNLEWDIEAPQKLGIYSIWNDFKQEGLPSYSSVIPDKVIHSIYGLAREINS